MGHPEVNLNDIFKLAHPENHTIEPTTFAYNRSLLSATTRKKWREGKERKWKVHKVTRRYISPICGADTRGPIPIKFVVRVAPQDVIKISDLKVHDTGIMYALILFSTSIPKVSRYFCRYYTCAKNF